MNKKYCILTAFAIIMSVFQACSTHEEQEFYFENDRDSSGEVFYEHSGHYASWDLIIGNNGWTSVFDAEEVAKGIIEEARNPQRPLGVVVRKYNTLRQAVGKNALKIDHLKVYGPVDMLDFEFIKECANWGKLRTVDLSEASVRDCRIPNMAFSHNDRGFIYGRCIPLVKIVLPDDIREIGPMAFHGTLIESINLPSSLRKLGLYCFAFCPFLKELIIPDAIEEIPAGAFMSAGSLKRVEIPGTVKVIGQAAFRNSGIEELILHEGLTEILGGAFSHTKLKELRLPSSVIAIRQRSFGCIPTLTEVHALNPVPPIAVNDGLDKFKNNYEISYPDAFEDWERCSDYSYNTQKTPTPQKIPVYVPAGSEKEYSRAKGWDWFSNFVSL